MARSLIFFLLFSISGWAQQTTAKVAFLEKWEHSKLYLMAIGDAMPENLYDYKPTERQMSFEEQLEHIRANMHWLSETYFNQENNNSSEIEAAQNKAETLALLAESFDRVRQIITDTPDAALENTVNFFAGPKSRLQILNLLQDHVTHHRGQLVVYLNLNEIEPPKYVGW